jgi:hypothetical protein
MVDILLLSLLHFFTLRKVELLYFMILVLDNAKSQFRLYLSWATLEEVMEVVWKDGVGQAPY